MGACCTNSQGLITETVSYENLKIISIKEKDAKGKVLRLDDITVSLTYPSYQHYEKINLDKMVFEFSSCVIPGLDPRALINKECQDALFYTSNESAILVGLFDGHGKEGQKVSHFCCRYMKEYFQERSWEMISKPEEGIENIIEECDRALRDKSSGIEAGLSGTTALVMLITVDGYHVGSVGDSRAILGTLPPPGVPVETPPPSTNRYIRQIEPIRLLKTVPLSVDQKPNHEAELKRIEKSGGTVRQLTDDYGNKIGPFRVWQKNGVLPGLAMSRSIGDGIAKEIGVISTPVYHFFPHIKFRDQFIVISSDGVWDVFENIEVINFVERFRKKCFKGIGPKPYPHRLENSSISQLTAEEARYRWFGICEEEDVMIDDISVVVIEVGSIEPQPMQLPPVSVKRKTVHMNVVAEIIQDKDVTSAAPRGDLLRGSFIPANDPKAKKARLDPKRGSYVAKEEKKSSSEGEEEETEGIEGVPFVNTEINKP
ncbi:hypothetical protein SteCoe_15790 [Stentor coeruleus]|uniref:PPM-type phosphatase domain-containing protein n=1 Tax=Stentor coeruleus TaxID=5963 RepID=A0A1R2C2V6_9CILI|nr:hypothetical protein SteCoe_15790 [Stentor coeruleus]